MSEAQETEKEVGECGGPVVTPYSRLTPQPSYPNKRLKAAVHYSVGQILSEQGTGFFLGVICAQEALK